MKRALITGINGQDGSYLAEFLLEKGYDVYGIYRRSSTDNHLERIEHLIGKVKLFCTDLTDFCSMEKTIKEIMPDEIYNLAAQSQVRVSFDQPHLTKEINWLGVERIIECVKKIVPKAKFYQASTSEMFGNSESEKINEETPFNPQSPYAESKIKAHEVIKREREKGLFACNGILFNHESPRRGVEFVTRKITEGIARIKLKLPQRETGTNFLEMGNLDAKRDWGYAKDYVEAMWLMLQQNQPRDYIVSSGESHSVREFLEIAAKEMGIQIYWKGEGVNEIGYDKDGNKIIAINPKFYRPTEVHYLKGDSSKARELLNWKSKTKFNELVKMMVEKDLERLKKIYSI